MKFSKYFSRWLCRTAKSHFLDAAQFSIFARKIPQLPIAGRSLPGTRKWYAGHGIECRVFLHRWPCAVGNSSQL
jgi:hypothetical protein